MMFKKWTLLMIGILLITKAFSQKIVEDANVIERELGAAFNEIKINGNLEVWLSQDAVQSLAVSANKVADRDAIQTSVYDGVLHISGGKGKKNSRGRVYVSFKTLEKLDLGGLVTLKVIGSIRQTSLNLKVSGISEFDGALSLENFMADISGISKMKLKGKTLNAKVTSSGSSALEGLDFEAENWNVTASGISDIAINAPGQLTVTASGTSKVVYRGTPSSLNENLTGTASLKRKD